MLRNVSFVDTKSVDLVYFLKLISKLVVFSKLVSNIIVVI